MRRASKELGEFLQPYSRSTRDIAMRLRRRVLKVVPNAHETVWDASNAVSIAFSTQARSGVSLCHVAVYANHVNLGFAEGARLPDPARVLAGTGRHIRHATFRTVEETRAEWMDQYLEKALAMAGLDPAAGDGGTTIRVMQGPKRRPDAAK